jgi:hypothetical protein
LTKHPKDVFLVNKASLIAAFSGGALNDDYYKKHGIKYRKDSHFGGLDLKGTKYSKEEIELKDLEPTTV